MKTLKRLWTRMVDRLSRVDWDRLYCDTFGHGRAREQSIGDRFVFVCPRCKYTLARSYRPVRGTW